MLRNKKANLIAWKDKEKRLPLILLGARQVGKTYLLKEFASEFYKDFIYINFELEPQMRSLFEKDLKPERIISEIELIYMKKIDMNHTLIFFDEIQLEMKAVTALKYFAEASMQYHIVGAGSLLGVALNRENYSFPVGKVEMHYLYPLTFDEFLRGIGFEIILPRIEEAFHKSEALPSAMHDQLIEKYTQYLYIGGMPSAINEFIRCGLNVIDFDRSVHENIINAYIADMSKYTTKAEVMKVQAIYRSIPDQLAGDQRKFKYNLVEKGAKALTFGSSIEWLLLSQVSIECALINRGEIPLSVYKDPKGFKLYFSDVGLLMAITRIPYMTMVREHEHNLFKGAVTENYVAQQLKARGYDLYYWKHNCNEVDFILQKDEQIIPIEVKASTNKRSRSLMAYIGQYQPRQSIRISKKNFGCVEGIKSVPLYAVYLI
ncbi:ATP-binding protein [Fusibacter sp. 3D3]|uniref:ATP-binding protein n=1 Tax=Fusibacter sp. 3D3 TaxID=1048380 RepID=UPI00085337F1|nr:AAA family ATPase [Fusibacter sp. 3D3]GAU78648.1 predicted ATPase [Fusibacter sp. 3D3]